MADHGEQNLNYINNLISRVSLLKDEVESGITLPSADSSQRDLASGLLSVLEYGLINYSNSNYGCCQEICENKTCYDPPHGFTSPEQL